MAKSVDADRIVLSTLIICKKMFGLEINLKNISLIEDKKLNDVTNEMLEKMLEDYSSVNEKIHSKEFSMIHLYMLKTKTNKIKYLKTFLKPTEYDYEKIKISKRFHFLYYFLRPFNIFSKSFNYNFHNNK